MKKYIDLLTEIGFATNEAKVYQHLLNAKEATISEIASSTGIHRRNIYDVMQRLLEKGFVYEILIKKKLTYAPIDPEKLSEILEEKMEMLNMAIPFLKKTFEKENNPQSIYIYKGVGGLKNYINLILKEGKDIYGIGSKGTWFEPRIRPFSLLAGKKLEKLKIKTFPIYDEEIKRYPEVLKVIGKPCKFLPKKYSSGSSIDIFGKYVAIYSGINVKNLDQDITIFIISCKTLAKDMMKWWQFMWDYLPEEDIK